LAPSITRTQFTTPFPHPSTLYFLPLRKDAMFNTQYNLFNSAVDILLILYLNRDIPKLQYVSAVRNSTISTYSKSWEVFSGRS